MAIQEIKLELIDDNPFNPRKHYPKNKIEELAYSIKQHGLLETPQARQVDGRYQLAFGGMRKRAFQKEHFETMPLDIQELTDEQMFYYALEENLKRADITPIEVARSIDNFISMFPDKSEEEVGKEFKMTQAAVSNMRRVLRCPEKILEKVDEDIINFTMARELLTFDGLENSQKLMNEAIGNLKTGNKSYGEPVTVEGMQKAVHSVARSTFSALDKGISWYGRDPYFDTRAAGCLKCDKMIITHPTKSQTCHWCTDEECWRKKQQEHADQVAAEAKAKMEADILKKATEAMKESEKAISQEIPKYTLEQIGSSWVAKFDSGVIIAFDSDKEKAESAAVKALEPVGIKLEPRTDEYQLNHTYRIINKDRKARSPDVTAQDLVTAMKAVEVKPGDIESVKVWRSSGKVGTGGYVTAGWSKCTEPLDETKKIEEELEERVDQRDRQMEEAREKANLERPAGELPCETCLKGKTCTREYFGAAQDDSGRYVCDLWECDHVSWAVSKEPTAEVPADVLALAMEKAGTRAKVLDLKDISTGNQYSRILKQGYTILKDGIINELRIVDDPEECTERCTKGFHYGYDSSAKARVGDNGEPIVYFICDNKQCLAQKKAALTRKKNAEGQARRKAETKAVKKAVHETFSITRNHIKVIILAQMLGTHVRGNRWDYYDKAKLPEKWLWDKLSAGTKEAERTQEKLFKAIDKLSDEDMASLLIDMMFYFLMDHGDVDSHTIKTELPLSWLGVKIDVEKEKESEETPPENDNG